MTDRAASEAAPALRPDQRAEPHGRDFLRGATRLVAPALCRKPQASGLISGIGRIARSWL
jgi:hypothetical protein